jgi:hypothetical protein
MSSSGDAVRCTVHNGAMWIHMDSVSVKVPEQLMNRSEVLIDAVSVGDASVARTITLAIPKEWLQAWVGCYCTEEESLKGKDINVLVNCLLVCSLCLDRSFHRDQNRFFCRNCVHSLSITRLSTSALPDSMDLILVSFLLGS